MICLGPQSCNLFCKQVSNIVLTSVSANKVNCRYEGVGGLILSGEAAFQVLQQILGLLCVLSSLNNVNAYEFSYEYEIHLYEYEKEFHLHLKTYCSF